MVVRFDGVAFQREARSILADVNLTIESGEVVAVVGRSGAGKTTLLKLVNRLLLPTAGAVLVDGRDTRTWNAIDLRRRIGYVFQDVGLFPHMTVADNIAIVPRLERWAPERTAARTHELLALVGLDAASFAARRPHELSGGQRQRVGLARALAANPPVLLMDEPFGALDPVTRLAIRREFARIQERLRITVVFVTHDLAEAFALGDRVGIIDDRTLIACDTPAAISRSTDSRIRALLETLPSVPVPAEGRD